MECHVYSSCMALPSLTVLIAPVSQEPLQAPCDRREEALLHLLPKGCLSAKRRYSKDNWTQYWGLCLGTTLGPLYWGQYDCFWKLGALLNRFKAPSTWFGVDLGRFRVDPYKNDIAASTNLGSFWWASS